MQGYADLRKSSWILIDVITRHPQLDLLDPGIRYDAELLAEVGHQSLSDYIVRYNAELQGASK